MLEAVPTPVAIVGAGYLGSALAHELAGPTIVSTRTGEWSRGSIPSGARVVGLDVCRAPTASVVRALSPARALVVCYAPGGEQDRRSLYVGGARALVAALPELELERLVYTSSTSALPNVDDWLDEDCATWPQAERGRVQREAEQIVIDGCMACEIPWVVLRLAGLYGPGRELGRIYRQRGDRDEPIPGDGMQPTNLIHRDDAIRCMLAALRLDRGQSMLIHACDDDHVTRREMVARLAASRGDETPTWQRDPAAGAEPVGKRVRNDRMKSVLGLTLAHPTHSPS